MAEVPELIVTVPFVGGVNFSVIGVAVGIFVLLITVFALVRFVVLERLRALSAHTHTDIDDTIIDAVRGIRPWVYVVVALYASLQFFALPTTIDLITRGIFFFTVVWQLIEVALTFVRFAARRVLEKDEDNDGVTDPGSATASHMVTLLARIVLWALGGLFVLSNLGVEVTSLIAGLGIGGVAVAFALQGILSDLFASFSIYFDKPFRIGDFVAIGDDYGTIEKIGIKSTRIRRLSGEELVVANAELTTARVQNYKKMSKRRNVIRFGVTYDTPKDKVVAIPEIITSVLTAQERVELEYAKFVGFGDSALLFEVAYYVMSPDYATHLEIQQAFSFELMERFAAEGIEFAFPTQTVYVKQAA